MEFLKGKRTYIQAILVGLMGALFGLDTMLHDIADTPAFETAWLSASTYAAIGAMLGGGAMFTMRAAIPATDVKVVKAN